MAPRAVATIAIVALLCHSSSAAPPKYADTAEVIVERLHTGIWWYEKDLRTTPFPEVMEDFSRRHRIRVFINREAFPYEEDHWRPKASVLATDQMDGIVNARFLSNYLQALPVKGLTYLVRDDHIEITTEEVAEREAGLRSAVQQARMSRDSSRDAEIRQRRDLPLVSVASKSIPLSLILDGLTRAYGLAISIDDKLPQEVREMPISLRLLNVPADIALELIAEQARLHVQRKDRWFILRKGEGVLSVDFEPLPQVGRELPARDRIDAKKPIGGGPAHDAYAFVSKLQAARIEPDSYYANQLESMIPEISKESGITIRVEESLARTRASLPAQDRFLECYSTGLGQARLSSSLRMLLWRATGAPKQLDYLVTEDCIEITTASEVRRIAFRGDANTPLSRDRRHLPIVCVAVRNESVGKSLDQLSRIYGFNVVVSPDARAMMQTPVTAFRLNIPADTAVALLATEAKLHASRYGHTFRITKVP